MTNDLDKPKTRALGALGKRILVLANDLVKEISSTWDDEQIQRIKDNGAALVKRAEGVVIETQEEYDAANEFFLSIAQYDKSGSAVIDPVVESAHLPHQMVCDIRREFKDPAAVARKIVNDKIVAYKENQEKKRIAEQARLDAERKAKEAEERAKLEAKAREERLKAEQARKDAEAKAEIERKKAEQAREAQKEAERREHEAREAEAKAQAAAAAAREAKEKAEREAAEAKKNGDLAEARAAQERADKLKAEEALAKERFLREESAAIAAASQASAYGQVAGKADLNAQKAIDKGAVAEQRHLSASDTHASAAETVFVPPTVVTSSVNKSEVTSKGTAAGVPIWDVTITDEAEIVRAVARGINEGGFPISILALDPEKMKVAFARWAKVSELDLYERNGVRIVKTQRLTARPSSKAKV